MNETDNINNYTENKSDKLKTKMLMIIIDTENNNDTINKNDAEKQIIMLPKIK